MAVPYFCAVVLAVLPHLSGSVTPDDGCYKELPHPLPSHVLSKTPESAGLPSHFNWQDTVTLSPPTNQFLPSPCGSCWAHAVTGALTDRIIIAQRKAKKLTPVVPLSPQVLLDCQDKRLGSCYGGSSVGAYAFIKDYGITDLTCSPYMGVDANYWGESSCSEIMCRQCDRYGNCRFVNTTKQYISEYGSITGESAMKAEIYARGPIACSVYSHSPQFEHYVDGVIQDPKVYNDTTHVVTITGWGTEKGVDCWYARNSFGSTWGEGGWFKLQRGVNALDIEKHVCAWAVPKMAP